MGLISVKALDKIPFTKERVDLDDDNHCFMRELLGGDVGKVYNAKDDESQATARMVLYGACNDKGERLFNSLEEVGKLKLSWLNELARVGFTINNRALGVDDTLEDQAKN